MVNAKIRLIIFFADKDKEALYSQQKQDWKLTGSDHELLIAKLTLKLKKVGKTTRPLSSVQLLSCVRPFATPWTAARQASLSITNSRSSFKLMSIVSVMPSSHLILCRPLLLLPPIPLSIGHFQWVNSSHEVSKVLEFQLQRYSFQRTPRADLL